MKKLILPLLVITLLAAGCQKAGTEPPQVSPPAETNPEPEIQDQENLTPEIRDEESPAPEESGPEIDIAELDAYMDSLLEQAELIETSLEQDLLSQTEMNQKAEELYILWDDALNDLWDKLKLALPEADFAALLDEQLAWIADKEAAVEAAGKDVEGGSIHPLVTNSEAARITEERVYELYDLLKQQAA